MIEIRSVGLQKLIVVTVVSFSSVFSPSLTLLLLMVVVVHVVTVVQSKKRRTSSSNSRTQETNK
jgi:hypothetical protein